MTAERLELEARLTKARAERAKIAAARADADALEQLRAEVEQEEFALRDAPAIAAAEEKHGAPGVGTVVVETRLGAVVVKRPHAAIFRKFADKASTKSADVEALIRPCVVYPDAAALDRILDEQPAVLTRIADAVVVLGGAATAERSGK